MASRDLATLERAIDKADKTGLQKRLGLQLQAAQRMLEHLQRIEKAKSAVMKMNQKTTAEIKSYSKPPEVVHTVMSSTYMILGEPEAKVKVTFWIPIIQLFGPTIFYNTSQIYDVIFFSNDLQIYEMVFIGIDLNVDLCKFSFLLTLKYCTYLFFMIIVTASNVSVVKGLLQSIYVT